MLNPLKLILSKLFPKKLATEVTAELPTPTPVPVYTEEVVEQPVLLVEPAPEPLQVIEEPVIVPEKKKKKGSKKKKK